VATKGSRVQGAEKLNILKRKKLILYDKDILNYLDK
jgi:hypothetical protein